jgi:hypothetical protein
LPRQHGAGAFAAGTVDRTNADSERRDAVNALIGSAMPQSPAIAGAGLASNQGPSILAENSNKLLILLMEATTRIELVYTVLQTVA